MFFFIIIIVCEFVSVYLIYSTKRILKTTRNNHIIIILLATVSVSNSFIYFYMIRGYEARRVAGRAFDEDVILNLILIMRLGKT